MRELAAGGTPVIAVDRSAPDAEVHAYLAGLEHLVRFREADITQPGWADVLAPDRVDAAIHAAAVTALGVDEQVRALEAATVNVVGTANVVGWAAAAGVRRLVHVSTAAVYGPVGGNEPIDEGRAPQPDTVYGITKLAGESLARRVAGLAGLELVVARLSHVYGPMERPTSSRRTMSPICGWVRSLVDGVPLRSSTPGLARDFIHVADAADALRRILVTPLGGEAVCNVASGRWTTEEQLLATLSGLDPEATVELERGGRPAVSRSPLASDRLRRGTGWVPRFDIETGCRQYLHWVRARGEAWMS